MQRKGGSTFLLKNLLKPFSQWNLLSLRKSVASFRFYEPLMSRVSQLPRASGSHGIELHYLIKTDLKFKN